MANPDLLDAASDNQTSHRQPSAAGSGEWAAGSARNSASLLNIVDRRRISRGPRQLCLAGRRRQPACGAAVGPALLRRAALAAAMREGVYRFVDQDQCAWMRAGGSGMERSASAREPALRPDRLAVRGRRPVRRSGRTGSSAAASASGRRQLSVDNIADSNGNFYQGGIVAKHTMGNSILSASLTAGYGDFDITRYLVSSDIANGNETLWTVRASSAPRMPSCATATGTSSRASTSASTMW